MKRIMLAALLMGSLSLAAPPAALAGVTEECLDGCDEDFPGGDHITIAAKGWCYIIRCVLF